MIVNLLRESVSLSLGVVNETAKSDDQALAFGVDGDDSRFRRRSHSGQIVSRVVRRVKV